MNIVVTGASAGIGREVVLRLSDEESHNIVAIARDKKALSGLSDTARHKNIIPLATDLTGGLNTARALKSSLSAHFPYIDIMVYCAGTLVNKPLAEYNEQEINDMIAVNFTGALWLVRELDTLFRKGSHVVTIGSMGGFQGSMKFPGLAAYSATKGALAVLTECLAAEYAEREISFNCLCPGAVDTGMFRKAFPGHRAPVTAPEAAAFIADFAVNGNRLFNGKIIPMAVSVP